MPFLFLPSLETEKGGRRTAALVAGELEQGGAREEGEMGEESERTRSPAAARAEVVRGGLATTAGGRRAAAALGRRPGGAAAVKGRGKSEREPWGFDSPAHLGRRWPMDGSPRRQAKIGGGGDGGGAAGPGKGQGTAVEVVVVVERDLEAYL